MLNDLLSRRFLLCTLLILVDALLVWFDKIDDQVYSAIAITTITAFVIGNTASEIKKINTSKG